MRGVLWQEIQRAGRAVPDPSARDLAMAQLATAARNREIWRAIDRLQRLADDVGVQIGIAKGVVAEWRWYGGLGRRPSGDIDVFIRPDDLPRFGTLVERIHPEHPLADSIQTLVERGIVQSIDLTRWGEAIDLHSDILKLQVPVLYPQAVWTRTVAIQGYEGIGVRALDAELSLVHMLVHVNKDRFRRLLNLHDVWRILTLGELDWEFISHFVDSEGLGVPVAESLRAVGDALAIELPAGAALIDDRRRWVRRTLWKLVWPPSIRLVGDPALVKFRRRQFWIPFLMVGRLRDALRFWLRRLIPSREVLNWSYPDLGGPYLWKLVVGRLTVGWHRRRIVRRLEDRQRFSDAD